MTKSNVYYAALLLPAVLFLLLFFTGPLLQLFARGIGDAEGMNTLFTLLFSDVFRSILYNTVVMGFLSTLVTLVVAFPIVWFLLIARPWMADLVFGVIIVSMWTSLLARLFALSLLYKSTGPVNQLLMWAGLTSHPLAMMNNSVGVLIGMFYTMLPFMVLPIYNTMSKIDPALMQAASVCGARGWTILWRVLVPLCMPGIGTGCIVVFVTTMGYFIVPSLLGGASNLMIAQYIVEQIQQFLNWRTGTVAAIYLLVLTILMYIVYLVVVGVATKGVRRS